MRLLIGTAVRSAIPEGGGGIPDMVTKYHKLNSGCQLFVIFLLPLELIALLHGGYGSHSSSLCWEFRFTGGHRPGGGDR